MQDTARYGTRAAIIIIIINNNNNNNNHRVKLWLSGVSDGTQPADLTGLLDDCRVAQTSTSIGSDGRRSTPTSTTFGPLVAADQLH